jgi:hypothetical protein
MKMMNMVGRAPFSTFLNFQVEVAIAPPTMTMIMAQNMSPFP